MESLHCCFVLISLQCCDDILIHCLLNGILCVGLGHPACRLCNDFSTSHINLIVNKEGEGGNDVETI